MQEKLSKSFLNIIAIFVLIMVLKDLKIPSREGKNSKILFWTDTEPKMVACFVFFFF